MGTKENAEKAVLNSKIPSTIRAAIDSLAKGLGVAAIELWSIFVRQYVVKGSTQLFTGVSLSVAAFFLHNAIGWWALIPAAAAHLFFYGAIMLLGNPKYYAIQDITDKINELK